jgi:ketosteroid isomerase-like protein
VGRGCDGWRVVADGATIGGVVETNVELARRGFEAALVGDFDAIGALLDRDVKWHGGDPSAPGSCQNRAQALEFMRRAGEHGPLGELVDVVGAGDRVVVIMRPRRQDSKQAPLVANLTTFRGGKVTEMVHYPNPEDALAAAGI